MKLNKEDETLLFIKGECNLNLPLYRFAYGMISDKGQSVIMVVSDHRLLVAPARKKDEGRHSLYGIFSCYGKGITKKEHIRTTVYDIAPTVLKSWAFPWRMI